jgi:3-deoxy-D-manno-octulosonic acid (KDO) 8-phosphate synthase
LSDCPNAWPLQKMESLLAVLMQIDATVKSNIMHELEM